MNKVAVYGGGNSATKKIKHALGRALNYLRKKSEFIEVYFVSESEIKFLNKKFRGKNKTTNVLSFRELKKFPHPETSENYLGEIYLSLDHIKRKKEDLVMLAIHGLLHLLGYTHKSKRDTIKMQKYEKSLLKHV